MTSKIEITDAAVSAAEHEYSMTRVVSQVTERPMRAALAAALPFCKLRDDGPRLRLFDGRFTLPLVVQSFPGVSFIHPAEVESAPVAVITCDDHATIAAGIVDAIASAHTAFMDGGFRAANAKAMETIRSACGASLDTSWAEKAREIFGDQKRSTLLVIGSALAKIAEALPGRVHIEVGYPDEGSEMVPGNIVSMPDGPAVVNNTVTVNLSVASPLDADGAQGMADTVRRAVEEALQPADPVYGGRDIVTVQKPDAWMRAEDSHLLAKGHVVTVYPHPGAFTEYLPVFVSSPPAAEASSPVAETRAAILRDDPGLIGELQKMAATVGGVFVSHDNAEREKYIAALNARATAFETAIEAVKAAAPADNGVWSAHREWALRSIPDLERMMNSARREARIASAGAKA